MVDIVALVLSYLQSETLNAVEALPDSATRPVLRVEEAGGPPATSVTVNRLTKQDLQIDVWGETKETAWQLMADARDLLLAAPRYNPDHPEGVFTGVRCNGPTYMPDESWPVNNRPGPRYLMVVSVTAHV